MIDNVYFYFYCVNNTCNNCSLSSIAMLGVSNFMSTMYAFYDDRIMEMIKETK